MAGYPKFRQRVLSPRLRRERVETVATTRLLIERANAGLLVLFHCAGTLAHPGQFAIAGMDFGCGSLTMGGELASDLSVANGGLSFLFCGTGASGHRRQERIPASEHTYEKRKLLTLAIITILLLALSAAWGKRGNPTAGNQGSGEISGQRNPVLGQTSKDSATSVEQQIKTLHEQRRNAALQGDAGFFEKYLADDYLGSRDDGRLSTKEQEVRMVSSGVIKYEAIDERDVKVRVYGETAIVSALASVKLSVNGKPITGDQRATFVWVKQEGKWKLASFQATRVALRIPRPGNNLGHDARPAPR